MAANSSPTSRGVYRFAVATASFTVLLLMAGALVTNNDAGDSVPDWPLAYHRLIPPLVGGIRFEYSHRVIAGIVSIMTLALAVWITARDRRPLAKRLGWIAVALVLAQAILGGIRVLEGDPIVSATAHATLAQIFFITLVGIALYVSPWWQSDLPQLEDSGSPRATTLGWWSTFVILGQILLGAAFRHGALGIVPHLIGAGVVTVMVIWTGRVVKRRFREVRDLRRRVMWLHMFFGIQILLGFAAWWAMTSGIAAVQPTFLYVTLTAAHVVGGALTIAASVLLALTCQRLTRPAGAAAVAPSAQGVGAAR
ncbi:MAG TPA: COX15/CtaA family protein [Candidatus Acidoferrales bacterium]|nr:COX15/CtaA family protein [Candidatus Acidoferrales bacterium]